MPLIILGLLVAAGLAAYVIISEHPEWFVQKKKDNDAEQEPPSVIYLEEERKKRGK